jgi:DNA-directed RNA polymerase specialized sigma24 family protein
MPQFTDMDLPALREHCLSERAKFRAYQESDPVYCQEIFRRAMLLATDESWEALQVSFHADALRWVRQHPAAQTLQAHENADDYVQEAFTRLYHAARKRQLEFPNLAAAMSFLRRCVNSVMLDHVRSRQREFLPIEAVAENPSTDEIALLIDAMQTEELWQMVEKCITAPRELRLARLLWIEGYKPREVPRYFPDEFPTVEEVRAIIGNVVQRLRRSYRTKSA